MHISIITAAFRRDYMDGVWESIQKQTYKAWEWIIVCDGSQDIRDWYRFLRDEKEFEGHDVWFIDMEQGRKKFGLVARNVGATASKYNYLQFLDDDNALEEDDYLETMVKTVLETGKIPYSKLHIVGKKPGSTVDRYKDTHPTRHHIDLGNPLYPKDLFIKAGLFNDRKNRIMFDYDLIEEIIKLKGGLDNFVKVDKHLFFRHKRY